MHSLERQSEGGCAACIDDPVAAADAAAALRLTVEMYTKDRRWGICAASRTAAMLPR